MGKKIKMGFCVLYMCNMSVYSLPCKHIHTFFCKLFIKQNNIQYKQYKMYVHMFRKHYFFSVI